MNKKVLSVILFFIISIGVGLRLYKLDNPIADWHEFRQADTASVSRNYIKYGIDLLKPTYGDLSNIQSGKDNPKGYRFVEFPIYNGLHALLVQVSGLTIEKAGRLLSVILSVVGLLGMWFLARLIWDDLTAILIIGFASVNAYWVYYSRVILPEPLMITSATWALYFLVRYIFFNEKKSVLAGGVLLSIALLVKPFIIVWFIGLPLFIISKRKWKQLIILTFIFVTALLPFLLWRWWIQQFPEGIPASRWLFNGDGIRFRPAFFRWLFYERISKLILGGWGVAALIIGLAKKISDKGTVIYGMLIGSIVYLFVIATGNVRHDYYQILLFPALAFFVGRGLKELITGTWVNKKTAWLIACGVFFGSNVFGWYEIKGYYQINHPEIIEAGQHADKILPKSAKVIAPYFGDTAFLYQTNRPGWPLGYGIEDKINKGATAYVSVNFDQETQELMQKYKVLIKTPKYVIINLKEIPTTPSY